MMTGPGNLVRVASSTRRLTSMIESVLTPGERLTATGIGWAAQLRPKVPLVFLGRRQYWFALTDRRMLVFSRRRGGPGPEDLVLGKRYPFFWLEKVHRHRPLFQIRIRGANDSRLVLEFRPGHRGLAAELVARLTRALPPPDGVSGRRAVTPQPATPPASQPTTATEPGTGLDVDTAAAFWGER